MKKINTKAFTLIELLVVITIIGILATGAISTYTTQIQKARDATRISDWDTLKTSIAQYYQDIAEYPTWWKWFLSWSTTSVQTYLWRLPKDPKDHQSCNWWTRCGFAYMVSPDSNGITWWAYELSYAFEASSNREQKAAKDWGNDDKRYEISVWGMNLDTTKPSSGSDWWTTALDNTDTSPKIHIWWTGPTDIGNPTVTAF